ncbi:hypothetical protein STEG23_005156 [Scotinomys teguina]
MNSQLLSLTFNFILIGCGNQVKAFHLSVPQFPDTNKAENPPLCSRPTQLFVLFCAFSTNQVQFRFLLILGCVAFHWSGVDFRGPTLKENGLSRQLAVANSFLGRVLTVISINIPMASETTCHCTRGNGEN